MFLLGKKIWVSIRQIEVPAEGQRKSRNSTVESTRRPCLGMVGKGMTPKPQQPGLYLTCKMSQKKQFLILRNLKSRRFKKQFLQFGCTSVCCLGIFALFGTFWGLPDFVGSTKMSNGQPLAVAASSRLAKGAWCVELRCCAYKRNTFWDGNQTVRNEMLLTVLKINLKISSKN